MVPLLTARRRPVHGYWRSELTHYMQTEVDSVAREKAAEEKAAGTTAYKAKNFEEAIARYSAAAALDPTDMVFHLNLGAVHFEMKDYAAVHEDCRKALDVGMENRADFKLLAKAYGRIAKAFVAENKLSEAVEAYDKALTNHRDKIYLNPKKDLEKQIREAKRREYINPELGEVAKAKGNEYVKAQDYPNAIQEYTEALKRNPDDATFASRCYSNRSMCFAKKMAIPDALKDADECIKLDPNFVKGYLRRGHCLTVMQKYDDALSTYRDALKISPGNSEVRENMSKVTSLKYGAQANMTQEERAAAAMKDPEVVAILNDPIMSQVLQQIQSDPSALQEHMKNEGVREKLMKLVDSGILMMR